MNINQIFANNKVWITEKLKGNPEYFKNLSLGQSPEILYIGCSDSRVSSEDMGILNPWLRNIRDVYRIHRNELDAIADEDLRYKRLVELNVQEQCVNVLKTADVQKAYKERTLTVHGWVFDIKTGQLIDLKIDFDKILMNIMEIYRII